MAAWTVPASNRSLQATHPIRRITEDPSLVRNPDKEFIPLSAGDPTVFGNIRVPDKVVDTLVHCLQNENVHGYAPSAGYMKARSALAASISTTNNPINAKDIFLTSGCSAALDICLSVLANPGQNILAPRPGYHLFCALSQYMEVEVKFYNLLPEKDWEIDLPYLDSLIDENTAAVVIINPSNPCGSVYSRQHMTDLLAVLQKHKVPVISDEIYEHFTFSGFTFHSFGSVSVDVPVLVCSGLGKGYLVPGWKLGWIIVHDRHDAFKEVRKGLMNLVQLKTKCPDSLVQGALADILANTPKQFFADNAAFVETNARFVYQRLSKIEGLEPIMPRGSFFIMVGIKLEHFPGIETDREFILQLNKEQSVLCLPGECFSYPGYIRIVLTIPTDTLETACDRIEEFCNKHRRSDS